MAQWVVAHFADAESFGADSSKFIFKKAMLETTFYHKITSQ